MTFSKNILLPLVLLLIFISKGFAQKEIELADEYFAINEFKKAEKLYENYIFQEGQFNKVYDNYRECLLKTNQVDALYKSLKKLKKRYPEKFIVHVDLLVTERQLDKTKEFQKDYKSTYALVKKDNYKFLMLYDVLMKRGYFDLFLTFITDERKARNDGLYYSIEVMEVYKIKGENKKWIDEALDYLEFNFSKRTYIEDQFQLHLKEEDYTYLETQLLQRIGASKSTVYQSLLVWLYIQQKDFYSAFQQQRSIDRERREYGVELYKLAEIAIDNNALDDAVDILSYITKTYPDEVIYINAQKRLIELREQKVIATYPVDTTQVNSLITDYRALLKKSKSLDQRVDIQLKQIRLVAFELHDNERAIQELNKLLSQRGISAQRIAKVQLLLADVYLFDDQKGEASLLYFKVEKRWKSGGYAEQAKLKNAMIYYYSGEFSLAQSMLDILKKATTREISNDAIELSVFIKSNSGLDTSFDALQLYADSDLLTYQKKYNEALTKLDELLTRFPFHTLVDEVYWKKAQIYKSINDSNHRKEQLQLIVEKYSKDIWADDATYELAKLCEKEGDKKSAMEYYKRILLDYKGSIYLENSRMSYRRLRGDRI